MKRSEINGLIRDASACFSRHGWTLPPQPKWDVTDFGLGDITQFGLVLVNLAEEPEYCEKLMYARSGMTTPAHKHIKKKEDIVCRHGRLRLIAWSQNPLHMPLSATTTDTVVLKLCGKLTELPSGHAVVLEPGERVTLLPGTWHEFVPMSDECIIGEISTANDDTGDNVFADVRVGRFPRIVEDELAETSLISDL